MTVRIVNRTAVSKLKDLENQSAGIMRTFTSTHTILQAQGGEWISLTDPPPPTPKRPPPAKIFVPGRYSSATEE